MILLVDFNLITQNFFSPPILFFFLGMLSVAVKSDLHIPNDVAKFFSLYLLMDIGFKGGHELYHNGFSMQIAGLLAACMIMACVTPFYCYFILRKKFDVANSAAMAATFGSVSAVTFITAQDFLRSINVAQGGYMVAGMALMESPAIIIGVMLFQLFNREMNPAELALAGNKKINPPKPNWGHILKDAFFNGSVMLLVGSLVIGLVTGNSGWKAFMPFDAIFKGILAFYLLDNGIVAAQRLKSLKGSVTFLIGFGTLMPLFNATLGILICKFILGASIGDSLLFTILCASASYIAVPAAMRLAIPQANPAFTVPVALSIVFPFNIIIGIPLYYGIIEWLHKM
ncbi:MAG: sodium-dependent bicarbonate transport family permease [Bacteroidetes bacterium]|nr:MAG: sodium-dependent bicarbonate transport family permease [Bacteroidota bacterium]TAG88731.1 MAG: sodium-dependent bicarbonate transport family permease [Bacteroidota bacterium]